MSAADPSPFAPPPADTPRPVSKWRADTLAWVRTTLLVTALGLPVGLLWLWLAPRLIFVVRDGDLYYRSQEDQSLITIDVRFALIALLVGAVVGAVTFVRGRQQPVPVLLGVVAGGVLGSLLAMYLGHWLGPGPIDLKAVAKLADQTRVEAPLKLRAKGVLLLWPLASALAWLTMSAVLYSTTRRAPLAPLAPAEPGDPEQTWASEPDRSAH